MRMLNRFVDSDIEKRKVLLEKIERFTELPLLFFSFAMIPLLVGPILWELDNVRLQVFFVLEVFIWALFAIDLTIKIVIAPKRVQYIREHWLEVVVVAVPWFRPLRIIRVFLYGVRGIMGVRRLVQVDFLLVYALGLVIIAATIVTSVETSSVAKITSFEDAMWWSIVTVTTVGYGDIYPVTPAGRVIAMCLMLVGIGLFGGLTANLASLLLKADESTDVPIHELLTEIRSLREDVALLSKDSADG